MKNVPEIIFGWCFTFDAVYSSNVGFMYMRYYPSKHVYIGPLTVFSGHRGIPAPRRPASGGGIENWQQEKLSICWRLIFIHVLITNKGFRSNKLVLK